ncbi:helix-turn-helix transcriptional regulator [Flavobacterium terrigena]|uniref:Uncharacterized protein n=1 Tax=Flavobacterium terrigena TaxID=402734 RepID=A0A1H6QME1_9FLAO|nr:hypothetical protein [Flavobacterium terrigena]SEI40152.1 hypothetical protein SAMN05660918_0357 [Flavobacterium terrigena]
MNIRIVFICLFISNFQFISAQNSFSNKEIDSLLNINKLKMNPLTPEKGLNEFKKLYHASLKNKYKIGISYSLIGMGQSIGHFKNYKTALSYVNQGKDIANKINNDSLLLYADYVTSLQFGGMRLNKEALKLNNDCFDKIDIIQSEQSKNLFLGLFFTCKAAYSSGLSNNDFIVLHKKAHFHFSKVKHLSYNPSFTNLGCCFKNLNQIDSAKYYFEKALVYSKKNKNSLEIEYANLANLNFDTSNYEIAMKYLDSSNIYSKKNKVFYLSALNYNIYKKIYLKKNDKINAFKMQELELKYKDSADIFEKKRVSESFNYLLESKNVEKESIIKKYKLVNILFIIFIALSIYLIEYFYKKRRILKENFNVQEIALNDKLNQIIDLKQKVLSSYDELISLGKNDDPLFVSLFIELYPDFYKNLIEINPDLTLSEKKVCFYIKLKFTSKEIATYTFVSMKAIQNRKNRLRKRLFIEEGEDIYKWFEKL